MVIISMVNDILPRGGGGLTEPNFGRVRAISVKILDP